MKYQSKFKGRPCMGALAVSMALGTALAAGAANAADFVCEDDIETMYMSASEQAMADQLWNETLTYLSGFAAGLETSNLCLDAPLATIQTNDGKSGNTQTRCISRYRDVELTIKHVNWVLDNPREARQCFDLQKNYSFQLYTPTRAMKRASKLATWIDRPTLEDYYGERQDPVAVAGRKLIDNFEAILENTESTGFIEDDITYNGLPELWTAVGWLPFYAAATKAINPEFRGGYAYAEVMGPWGLLRIKEIDGESVGAEIGMTIQNESFYPYHFHHSPEIYMNIGKSACEDQNRYMVMNWDNGSFEQEPSYKGWDVTIDKRDHADETWFRPTSPTDADKWIAYYERNAIHATNVGGRCGSGDAPAGFAQVWARTLSRDNNQTTQVCVPLDENGDEIDGADRVLPDDPVVCHTEKWLP
jgi:hypothetical protein